MTKSLLIIVKIRNNSDNDVEHNFFNFLLFYLCLIYC